jgi:CheY-like chemotaxis protein
MYSFEPPRTNIYCFATVTWRWSSYYSIHRVPRVGFYEEPLTFMPDTEMIDLTEELASAKERRHKSRLLISAPVRVRTVGREAKGNASDESTTTVNLSPSGILIETDNQVYHRNMKVAVTLFHDPSAAVAQPEHAGIVVRVSELRKGRHSVAIALESEVSDEHVSEAIEKHHRSTQKSESVKLLNPPSPELLLPLVVVLSEESAVRESISAYLSGEGYRVITVSKAEEARSLMEEYTPALVIAEIEGEGLPGYDVCAHCKQTPKLKRVPVLLMTSSAYPSDYAKAHSLGAVVCMAKPYRKERLGHVVRLLAPPLHADKNSAPPKPRDASRRTAGTRLGQRPSVTVR